MKLQEIEFKQHKAVEILTTKIHLIITTDLGPRIAFFGKPGEANLLLWDEGKYFRNHWELKGGHRIWVTRPLADECEETYKEDTNPCRVFKLDQGWEVAGAVDPVDQTQRGLKVQVLDEDKLQVDNYITNRGNLLYSGGVWALTCTLPNETTTYAIPLGDGSSWDFCRIVMFRRWEKHAGRFNDDQITFTEDLMLIRPRGKENKRMLQADRGIIAMHDPARNLLFAKQTVYDRTATYPLGCNIAAYIGPDNFMVEMETMGPESMLKPEETAHNVETWVLGSSTGTPDCKNLTALFA